MEGAREQAERFRTGLAERAGGMLSRADAAELLEVSEGAVEELRKSGRLLGVSCGAEIRFPAAQFAGRAVLPGLEAVLAAFGDMNPWGQLQLLVAPIDGFGKKPASLLDLLAMDVVGTPAVEAREDSAAARWSDAYLTGLAHTIGGGTKGTPAERPRCLETTRLGRFQPKGASRLSRKSPAAMITSRHENTPLS